MAPKVSKLVIGAEAQDPKAAALRKAFPTPKVPGAPWPTAPPEGHPEPWPAWDEVASASADAGNSAGEVLHLRGTGALRAVGEALQAPPPKAARLEAAVPEAKVQADFQAMADYTDQFFPTDVRMSTPEPQGSCMNPRGPSGTCFDVRPGAVVEIEPSPVDFTAPTAKAPTEAKVQGPIDDKPRKGAVDLEPSSDEISDEEFKVEDPGAVGGGTGVAPVAAINSSPAAAMPSTRAVEVGRLALSVYPRDKCTLEQQEGLNTLDKALEELKIREDIRLRPSGAASSQGYSIAGSSAASSAGGSAATTGNMPSRRAKKEARRRSCKQVYGKEEDAGSDFDPEAEGYTWCGGAYYVKPSKVQWCHRCEGLDDWKVMKIEFVKNIPAPVLERHKAAKEANPKYPELNRGAMGDYRLYTCTACISHDTGTDERTLVTQICRMNKGNNTYEHSKERVEDFKRRQNHAESYFKVLLGFCVTGEGELALRRATEGVGVGIDPTSTGAPPATEEVAEEVGRPMARGGVQGEPLPPLPASEGEDATMTDGGEWHPTDRAGIDVDVDMNTEITQEPEDGSDVHELLRQGFSRKTLKRLASCYGRVRYQCVRTLMTGMLGCILEKQGDMRRAVGAAEKVSNWFNEIESEVAADKEMQEAKEGEAENAIADFKAKARSSVGEAKKEFLKRADEVEGHLNNIRAFRKEANGDYKLQLEFQAMADYTDQFYRDENVTMNVYYKCDAHKSYWNPGGCKGLIRSDRWTQLMSIEEEREKGG